MGLLFKANEIVEKNKGLTFDDVLLMPQFSEISTRLGPSLKTVLTKSFQLDIPIVSANMDTITEWEMCYALAKLGGVGILHRFMSVEEQGKQIKKLQELYAKENLKTPICASVGVKEEGMQRADYLVKSGVQILTVDIAHGDSVMMLETLTYIKKKYPHIEVIAGNVANPTGVKRLIDAGADAIKVGIGPGSMCTTRIITGCGVPQLTAISLCVDVARKHNIPVIADGGIRSSGDIVKALAAGADMVMLGSMLAGSLETPGDVQGGMKRYRGMASKDAQVSWRGELPNGMAPEGESTRVACTGSVKNIIEEICGGIRSGMSYLNAKTIHDMRENSYFMEVTPAGREESRPHGVKK